ncbi:hypothetical protein E2C01_054543 [Portunus trituberculatus]|uniref:Uncharacterized protein n=1 Tax=Portunus trituberculatus TaxID=210409 RepID=A0A5B7GTH8_PORTR|nr:hypothetical protein [Portunus trituberculatus]
MLPYQMTRPNLPSPKHKLNATDLTAGHLTSLHAALLHTVTLNVRVVGDRVESKAFRLINFPPLFHRRNVVLANFYSYFHANCSTDLANCMPLLLLRPLCTRLSSSSHTYSVQLFKSNARVNQYSESFITFSGKLRGTPCLCLYFQLLMT